MKKVIRLFKTLLSKKEKRFTWKQITEAVNQAKGEDWL